MKLPAWEAGVAPGTTMAFLTQGNIHCIPGRSLVTTILGSCVAVCLWDRVLRQGGMNHYVLPTGRNDPPSARFGDAAIDGLHQAMLRLGCRTERMTAKLFGGAAVLPFGAYGATVGNQNVQLALRRPGGRAGSPASGCASTPDRGRSCCARSCRCARPDPPKRPRR
jgi:CheD chemotactic sensory transduction